MDSRWLTWTVIVICFVGSLQMVHRIKFFNERSYAEDEIKKYVKTWEAWINKGPEPGPPGLETIAVYAPDVYRILPAVVTVGLSRLPHSTILYWALLLVLRWAAWLLLYFFAQRWLSKSGAFVAVLCAIVVTSAPHYGYGLGRNLEIALGMLLTFSCLWALSQERMGFLWILFPLAILNREDALIVASVAGLYWLLKGGSKRYLYTAIGGILVFACIRGIGLAVVGPRPYYCDLFRIAHNLKGFRYLLETGNLFHPLLTFLITFVPLGIIAIARVSVLPRFLKACVFTFVIYLIAMFATIKLEEPYHWFIVIPLFIIPAIYVLLPQLRSDTQTKEAVGHR